jgi:hypothetical protein
VTEDPLGAIVSVQDNYLIAEGYCHVQVEDYSDNGDRILPFTYLDRARVLFLELHQSRSQNPQVIFDTLAKLS